MADLCAASEEPGGDGGAIEDREIKFYTNRFTVLTMREMRNDPGRGEG